MKMRTTIYHTIVINIWYLNFTFHDAIIYTMCLVYRHSYDWIFIPYVRRIFRNSFNYIDNLL